MTLHAESASGARKTDQLRDVPLVWLTLTDAEEAQLRAMDPAAIAPVVQIPDLAALVLAEQDGDFHGDLHPVDGVPQVRGSGLILVDGVPHPVDPDWGMLPPVGGLGGACSVRMLLAALLGVPVPVFLHSPGTHVRVGKLLLNLSVA